MEKVQVHRIVTLLYLCHAKPVSTLSGETMLTEISDNVNTEQLIPVKCCALCYRHTTQHIAEPLQPSPLFYLPEGTVWLGNTRLLALVGNRNCTAPCSDSSKPSPRGINVFWTNCTSNCKQNRSGHQLQGPNCHTSVAVSHSKVLNIMTTAMGQRAPLC